MFDWWKKRNERKKRRKELLDKYTFTTTNPYQAIIWKAAQKLACHLKRYGIICKPEETIRQYYVNASRIDGMDRKALFAHLYILEGSMYSTFEMKELDKNNCIMELRKIEMSLDNVPAPSKKGPVKLIDPEKIENEPFVLPKMNVINCYPKDRYPEQESIRSSRPGDLRRLRSRFDSVGADPFPEMDMRISSRIVELIEMEEMTDLREVIMENAGIYMTNVHLSELTGLYLLELCYRIKEVHGFDDPLIDGLLGLVVPGSKVLAGSENRDYVIPDDVKISLLTLLPGYQMKTYNDAKKIIDSVQVPSVLISEAEVRTNN